MENNSKIIENKSKQRLGAGLDAIFGNIKNNGIDSVPLNQIKASEWQPRKTFEIEQLQELAISIKNYGVLQPILLKKVENKEHLYEIVAGERRFRASEIANLKTIPAIVLNFSQNEMLEISMIENLQRQDLNPIEKAEGFAFLIEKLQITQEDLAKRLGISRSVIANYLRINTLSDDIKEKLATGQLTFGHAKLLVNKKDASYLAEEITKSKLTVREVEKKLSKKIDEDAKPAGSGDEIKRFEEILAQALDIEVKINCHKNAGDIILSFSNFAKLEEIIDRLCL